MSEAGLPPDDQSVLVSIYDRLVRFAGAVAPLGDDPEDLVHEALARTLAKRPLTDIEFPAAYLRRAILNLAMNRRRSLVRRLRALARTHEAQAVADDYPSDSLALLDLSPESRAVLWLVDVEGLSYADVGEQLGLSSAAARQRASRGRAAVRRRIEAGDFEGGIEIKGVET